jgi:fructokinase
MAATIASAVDRLARGMAHAVNILDPDVIVLGGGLSEVGELYAELPPRIAAWVFSDRFDTPIRKALHGPASGVRGAAWLWRGV